MQGDKAVRAGLTNPVAYRELKALASLFADEEDGPANAALTSSATELSR